MIKPITWDSENSICAIAYCGTIRIGHTMQGFTRFGGQNYFVATSLLVEKEKEFKTRPQARDWVENQFINFIEKVLE